MIKFNLIWILTFVGFILAFILFITFGYISTKSEKERYSFLRNFPFEMYRSNMVRLFGYIFLGFSFGPMFVILPLFPDFGDLAILSVFIASFFGLSAVIINVIFSMSTKYVKAHMVASTALLAFSFLMVALSSLHLFLTYSVLSKFSKGSLHMALGIFGGLLAIFNLFIIFNPKLKDWSKLEELNKGDEKAFIRPRLFPLAYSEWVGVFSLVIAEILFFISMLEI